MSSLRLLCQSGGGWLCHGFDRRVELNGIVRISMVFRLVLLGTRLA
jgi:hypothetical protein